MELYLKVRLAVSEGMSRRQAAKHFNISRDSVTKMLSYSTPPGYQRRSAIRRPKLDAFVATVDGWLDEDLKVPRKQRHTAKRVFDRLRNECGFMSVDLPFTVGLSDTLSLYAGVSGSTASPNRIDLSSFSLTSWSAFARPLTGALNR